MQWQAWLLVLHRGTFVVGEWIWGFHAVTLWQNETFHFLYHMNIITLTHFNSQTGKKEANNTS
jgi:hypothetical protein